MKIEIRWNNMDVITLVIKAGVLFMICLFALPGPLGSILGDISPLVKYCLWYIALGFIVNLAVGFFCSLFSNWKLSEENK